MARIIFVTDIAPGENVDNPASLAYELSRSILAETVVLPKTGNLGKLGLKITRKLHDRRLEKAEYIICYPFHVFFLIPFRNRYKTVVIGPDSATLLFKRLSRNCVSLAAAKYFILSFYFQYVERKIIENCNKYLVVGRSDMRFINMYLKPKGKSVMYLTHPCFSKLRPSHSGLKAVDKAQTRIIFSGELSKKYVGKNGLRLTIEMVKNLRKRYEIIFIGKRNFWLYEHVVGYNVRYVEWVDDYSTVLLPFDVHVIPLFAGAGTKNRVITALSYNCRVISTSIGLENTGYGGLNILKIKKSHLDDLPKLLADVDQFLENYKVRANGSVLYYENRMSAFKSDLEKYHLVENLGGS